MRIWPSEEREYLGADELGEHEEAELYSTELLNSFNSGNLPPHRLTLKVGAPVMLVRNLCPAKGLMNGTRLVVVRLSPRTIQAKILSGPCAGQDAIIPRIPIQPSDGNNVPVGFTRTQFPVWPAFAMTASTRRKARRWREWAPTSRTPSSLMGSFTSLPRVSGIPPGACSSS
eukprot:558469-Pyramimonas_sp.AAC.1